MRELERQTEIDQTYIDFCNALEDYGESSAFNDMWSKEHPQQHTIMRYEDAYVIEDIWLEVIKTYTKNQDKPTAYIEIDMAMADMDQEFFSAAAMAQDEMIPFEAEELSESEYWKWLDHEEKKDDAAREKWKDQPPLEGSVLSEAIELKPTIETRTCYNNITHTHYYKAINVKARVYTTIELEKLKSLMEMREFFYSLGFNHFVRA